MDFAQPQILGTVLIVAGVCVVAHTIRTARKVQESQLWPSVKGLVTSAVVKRSGGRNRVYRANIRYTYTVHGHEFTGNRCTLGGEVNTSSRGPAQARCLKYPEGSEPEVFYNPADPKDACLERAQEGAGFTIGIGGVFGAVGLALLLGLF